MQIVELSTLHDIFLMRIKYQMNQNSASLRSFPIQKDNKLNNIAEWMSIAPCTLPTQPNLIKFSVVKG